MSSNNPKDSKLVKKIKLAPLQLAMNLLREILVDSSPLECRGDEDCDHCYYLDRYNEIKMRLRDAYENRRN